MSMSPIPRDPASLPRRALKPILIPVAVALCTFALIAWNAWPVLRPSRTIEVTQALFVPGAAPSEQTSDETENTSAVQGTRAVQAAGWLESEPFITAATALADGVIEELMILEGDSVERGQILARMVDDDAMLALDRARAELARAEALRAESHAELIAAQENWDEPYELENAVASADGSLRERQAELEQLPALIRVQEALLTQSQEELNRVEEAYRKDAASEIEFVTAREQASAQAARLEAIRSSRAILQAAIARLESDLHAARRSLELRTEDRARLQRARAMLAMSEAEVTLRQAEVREAELELDRMTIRAPISGYVQNRIKAPGDKVVRMMDSPYSAHIAHLYDPSKLQVRVDVPLADAAQIFVGQQCEVVVEVLPDQTFQGEVLIVTHEADLQKNTLQVKVRVIDPDPVLRPEMLTRVKFLPTGTSSSTASAGSDESSIAVRIPASAIDSENGQSQVWLVADRSGGRGILRPMPITQTSDRDSNGWVTVAGSLQPGSMLASDPSNCKRDERVRFQSKNGGDS